MIAPDSSIVIAVLSPWHAAHTAARAALDGTESRLIAHVGFETTSALSRMPQGRRVSAPVVVEALGRRFPDPWLTLKPKASRAALQRAVAAGLRGGALYDALIAATAERHGVAVLSADRRARKTYEAMGAAVEYVVSPQPSS